MSEARIVVAWLADVCVRCCREVPNEELRGSCNVDDIATMMCPCCICVSSGSIRYNLAQWFNEVERLGRYLTEAEANHLDGLCEPWFKFLRGG